MTRQHPAIVLLGATGFTGRLIARALAAGDAPYILAARDPGRLRDLVGHAGGDTRVVDVLDAGALEPLLTPGDVVINTVGPFSELGEPVVRACVRAGAHYLDITGEQPWMEAIQQRYDEPARAAGVAVVNAMAFEYALGDSALALLAADAAPPLRSADIVYAWGGSASSRGTRRTVVRMLGRRGVTLREGRLRRRAQGARGRTVRFASGSRRRAVAFQCGEIVTAPRHLPIDTVRGWLVMGARTARVVPWVSPTLPILVPAIRPLLERIAVRRPDPTPSERDSSRFTIRVELLAGAPTVIEVQGRDPYGLTAEIAVLGARKALAGEAPGGVLAPSQLVDPTTLFGALEPLGVRLIRGPAG